MRIRLFATQAVLILVSTILAYAYKGHPGALAALYGGAIVVVTTLLQYWHLRRAERAADQSAGRTLRVAIRAEAERFGASIALFILGFGVLGLEPLPLIGAFILVQLAALVEGFRDSTLRKRHG